MENSIEAILRGGQFKKLIENALTEIRNTTNLKRVEIEVIYFLYRCHEHNTMTDICHHLQMNKGHISIAMDNLCKKAYVTQQQDSDDRRYVHYTLTDEAVSIAKQIHAAWEKMSEMLMAGVEEEDLKVFEKVSEQIGRNIESILKK